MQVDEASAPPAPAVETATEQAVGPSDLGTTSAAVVELAVKWNKQDIVIHVDPDESVQVLAGGVAGGGGGQGGFRAWPPPSAACATSQLVR